jgi:hypothetical protein
MDNKNKIIKTIMKNTNIKILFLSFVLLSVFSFAVTAQAAGDSLYVSPATLTVNAGNNITVSAIAGTSGDKICAVQGTIVFNNMTCQNITVTNGLLVQNSPTCSNPNFILAIPKCTTTDTTLFTVLSKAGNAGTASISFSAVKLAGVGVVVSTTSVGGNYTVNALPVVQTQTPPVKQPKVTKTTTPKTEQVVTASKTITPTPETNNLQASLAGATGTKSLLATIGNWFISNIIWIVVLIVATGSAYLVGRMSCKNSKR